MDTEPENTGPWEHLSDLVSDISDEILTFPPLRRPSEKRLADDLSIIIDQLGEARDDLHEYGFGRSEALDVRLFQAIVRLLSLLAAMRGAK